MPTKVENGQIDYRKRLRDRAEAKAASAVTTWQAPELMAAPATVTAPEPVKAPAKEVVVVSTFDPEPTAAPAPAPVTATAEKPAKAEKKTAKAKSANRTPNEVRVEAAAMVEELLEMTDENYNAAMQKLAKDDVMLYNAVVDAISNADATTDTGTV